MYAVQSLPFDLSEHKFSVPGRTMMDCDSMHSATAYAQKQLSLFSLHEWINMLKSARRLNPYMVELLEHTDFFDLKAVLTQLVTNGNKGVNWLKRRKFLTKRHTRKRFSLRLTSVKITLKASAETRLQIPAA